MAKSILKPVSIFISYSHSDSKYQKKLHAALSPLRRRGLIKDWYDGLITPGAEFEPEILRKLYSADIIILLLSQSYINSDFCWNTEREVANQRKKQKNIRVVGIVVSDVNLNGLELSHHKLLPNDKKAIQRWHPQDKGWSNVCEGIELVIKDLRYPSQVDDAIAVPKAVIKSLSTKENFSSQVRHPKELRKIESVSEFWERCGSNIRSDDIIDINGTFSQFAPMLMGPTKAKANLHKVFRQAIQNNQALQRQKSHTLNACLSVSAGQMVWRIKDEQSNFVYCGLYNSIVRNSILVLIARDYYVSYLIPLFKSTGQKTFEARIVGQIIELDNSPTKKFINKYAKAFIPADVVKNLGRSVYGLYIDGKNTSVEFIGNPNYLDGDIWIAVESEGNERFLTSFLNVSDNTERTEELNMLLKRAEDLPSSPRIIAQYDEDYDFAMSSSPISNKNYFLDAIWRFGFGS